MEEGGQLESTHHHGQGDEQAGGLPGGSPEQPVTGEAQGHAQTRPAQGLPHEERDPFQEGGFASCGQSGQDREYHYAHPVVEQGLPFDQGLQGSGEPGVLEDGQGGHRIGGGDDRAEKQGMDQGQIDSGKSQQKAHGQADEGGGGQGGEHGQEQHVPFLPFEDGQGNMHRPCEQEKAEHVLHKRPGKVDGLDEGAAGDESVVPAQHGQGMEDQDQDHGLEHEPHGLGQLQAPLVGPGEEGGQDQQHGHDLVFVHGLFASGVFPWLAQGGDPGNAGGERRPA